MRHEGEARRRTADRRNLTAPVDESGTRGSGALRSRARETAIEKISGGGNWRVSLDPGFSSRTLLSLVMSRR
jgi:hypothetical protein